MAHAVYAGEHERTARPPFTIIISAEKPSMKVGSDLMIRIHLTNVSDHDLDVSANINDIAGTDPNYVYEVRDSGGNLVPARVYAHPELATGHAVFGTVKPGESTTIVQDLNRVVDIRRAGKYTVQVSRPIPGRTSESLVRSNKITVTLGPRSGQ
jgi:hypothetical protein